MQRNNEMNICIQTPYDDVKRAKYIDMQKKYIVQKYKIHFP